MRRHGGLDITNIWLFGSIGLITQGQPPARGQVPRACARSSQAIQQIGKQDERRAAAPRSWHDG